MTTTPGYGNCYSFNFRQIGQERVSYQPGPFFGLSVVLYIDQMNYMKRGQSKQAGGRIVVHDSKFTFGDFTLLQRHYRRCG